MKNENC